jgi:hypothetical protein
VIGKLPKSNAHFQYSAFASGDIKKWQFSSLPASTRTIIGRAPDSVESLTSDSPSDAAKAMKFAVPESLLLCAYEVIE